MLFRQSEDIHFGRKKYCGSWYPENLFKFNKWNFRKTCKICSKLTTKVPEQPLTSSGVFIVNFAPFSSVSIVGFEGINIFWVEVGVGTTVFHGQNGKTFWDRIVESANYGWTFPIGMGRKFSVHKAFNLRLISTGFFHWKVQASFLFW